MSQDIFVPDIGDFKEVEVIDVLVKPGDRVEIDTALITIETEKATMDVPSSTAGVIRALLVKKGDKVSKGSLILQLDAVATPASAPAPAPVQQPVSPVALPVTNVSVAPVVAPVAMRPISATSLPSINEVGFSRAHASPSVRRFARELGVDLSRVTGSGVKGRITPEDVKAWVKQVLASGNTGVALPKVPEVDFAKFGSVELKPLGRIQKISGSRLHASWVNVPHVWQMDEADITDLEVIRKQLKSEADTRKVKLTPLAFVIMAVVKSLKEFPVFNASLDASGQSLVFKQYMNIGFAADTPNGLVVPVIRNADQKSVFAIAGELALLSEKAREGKLGAADMQGGCFTVSSLGGIGGTSFTPIINAPEVAILGVSKSSMKPIYNATTHTFDARLMLPFTLAYDHRVIDGALGARFTTYLSKQLANVTGLLAMV